jgi:predicted DNA-binding transcriptional regulator YafY
MNRVDRLMGYLLLFQSRGLMRAQDFAEQFEISERTVYRDVQALSEVGVPIMAMPGEGYRLMEGYYLPPITFSPQEARALYLAISMLVGQTTPGDTQTAALTALEKFRAVLPGATLRQVAALEAVIRFYAIPTTRFNFDDEVFVKLQEAIYRRQVVRLCYHTQHSNEVTERDVEPFELASVNRVWLLTGYCRLREAPRVFRLDRIDALKVCPETFIPREFEDWRPQSERFYVVVRVDAAEVRWVHERQHFSFDEEETANTAPFHGSADAILIYRPHTLDQIEGWLLSWGDTVEVLEPPELRERIAATAASIMRRHQSSA